MKVVEVSLEDFKKMTQDLKDCRQKIKQLEAIIDFLNNEIKDYNKKYAKNQDENKEVQ